MHLSHLRKWYNVSFENKYVTVSWILIPFRSDLPFLMVIFLSSSQMPSTGLIILFITTISNSEEYGVFFEIEENSFPYDEVHIWNGKVDSLLRCSQMCAREDVCKSAIFISKGGECSLYRETRQMHPDRLLKKEGSFYLEKVNVSMFVREKRRKETIL